jgi:ketosteroid isomerase-like protein
VTRQQLHLSAGSKRRLEERLGLRLPWALVAVNRAVLRLPPRSPIRRLMVRREVRLGIEASNRRDYDATFAAFHPDFEMNPPDGLVALGSIPSSLRGREERIRVERQWRSDWGEFRYEPDELLDLGDRILVLGRMIGTGPGSGATFNTEWAQLLTLSQGQVVREQIYFNRGEALEAAGLRE